VSRALRVILAALMCLIVLRPSPSVAGQQTDLERDLDRAKVLYRDGRLDEAVASLRDVIDQLNTLRDQQSRKTQLAEAHLYLALSYFAVRNESAALENFRQVVALDPSRTLDPEVYSPRVIGLFEQARGDVEGARIPAATAVPPAVRNEGAPAAAAGTAGSASLPLGTRVRVRLDGLTPSVTGNLLALDNNRITLVDAENRNLSFPRDTIMRMEVTRGRKGHWLKGMVVGTLIGAVGGAFETPGCGGNDGDCYTRGENIGYSAGGFGLVGALVGALYKTDQWVEVSLDRRTSVNRTADRKLSVTFAWRY